MSQTDSSMQHTNPKDHSAGLWAMELRITPHRPWACSCDEHTVGHTGEDPVTMLPKDAHSLEGKTRS